MTVTEFIKTHGDPTTWSDDEYEDFFDFATDTPQQPDTQAPNTRKDH